MSHGNYLPPTYDRISGHFSGPELSELGVSYKLAYVTRSSLFIFLPFHGDISQIPCRRGSFAAQYSVREFSQRAIYIEIVAWRMSVASLRPILMAERAAGTKMVFASYSCARLARTHHAKGTLPRKFPEGRGRGVAITCSRRNIVFPLSSLSLSYSVFSCSCRGMQFSASVGILWPRGYEDNTMLLFLLFFHYSIFFLLFLGLFLILPLFTRVLLLLPSFIFLPMGSSLLVLPG